MTEINARNEELLMAAIRGMKAIHDEVQTGNMLMQLAKENDSSICIKHDATNKALGTIDGNTLVTNELLAEIADSTKAIQSCCAILMPTLIRIQNLLEKHTGEKGGI